MKFFFFTQYFFKFVKEKVENAEHFPPDTLFLFAFHNTFLTSYFVFDTILLNSDVVSPPRLQLLFRERCGVGVPPETTKNSDYSLFFVFFKFYFFFKIKIRLFIQKGF
jgi:hypothetical protein